MNIAVNQTTTGTPLLPQASPESLGLSSRRLQTMSDAFQRQIDKGTLPGCVLMVARGGKIAWFDALGKQSPTLDPLMRHDSVFRIFSMTKPIVSIGLMMLFEEGRIVLNEPLSKYIPAFAKAQVGVARNGVLMLEPMRREITIQDLLSHTGGISYEITGSGPVETLYREAKLYRRNQTNEEHAATVASLPLISQPGAEWHYSRSTDILGRVIEIIAGQSLGEFLSERIFKPLRMTETGFHIGAHASGRLAEPFDKDPWSGASVVYFSMLDKPKMESGGGGLVSTAADYARFSQMLLNGGTLDGARLIGRKTLALMASNHLGTQVKVESPQVPPGHGFGLGFCVRMQQGLAPFSGSVGQYFWGGAAGTQFWIDPSEDLFAIMMIQAPGQRDFLRNLFRDLVYAALD